MSELVENKINFIRNLTLNLEGEFSFVEHIAWDLDSKGRKNGVKFRMFGDTWYFRVDLEAEDLDFYCEIDMDPELNNEDFIAYTIKAGKLPKKFDEDIIEMIEKIISNFYFDSPTLIQESNDNN